MSKYDFEKKGSKYCYRGYSRQFKNMKGELEESQAMLSDMKSCLEKQQLEYEEISRQLALSRQVFAEIRQQLLTQQEIMNLFYEEYQSLKKRQGKAQLMNYIRMRDSMLKDMAVYEERCQTNTMGYKLLAMYVNELTEILEDQSVEVLTVKPGKTFDPETQKPIERIPVYRPEEDNMVYKVYNCGYRWNGIMLKKIDVSVCIYR